MKNSSWGCFLLCFVLIACGQKGHKPASDGSSNFETELDSSLLKHNYVLYRSALSGNDVVKLISASSNILIGRLTAVEINLNAATYALKGSGVSKPNTPEKEFFEATNKFFPHLIANFDFLEGLDACMGQCSSPKKTEVDELKGKGIYIIDTLIDVRKTSLPDFTLSLDAPSIDGVTEAKINEWAKIGALAVIKNADSTGQYQNDSEKEQFLIYLERCIAENTSKYCAEKLKKHFAVRASTSLESSRVAIKLPSAFEISNIYLGVYHVKSAEEINSREEVGRVRLGFRTIFTE